MAGSLWYKHQTASQSMYYTMRSVAGKTFRIRPDLKDMFQGEFEYPLEIHLGTIPFVVLETSSTVLHVGFDDSYICISAVRTTKWDKFIQQAVSLGVKFTTVVRGSAQSFKTSSLCQETIVSTGAVIAAQTKIGCHVIVNRGCLIGHHIIVGDYVTISPGANIGGKVKIGHRFYIGMGAVILNGIKTGEKSVV